MSPVAGKASPHGFKLYLSLFIFLPKAPESSLKSVFIAPSEFPYNLARISQVKMPPQIIYSFQQRKNLRLLVKFQLKLFFHRFEKFMQAFP